MARIICEKDHSYGQPFPKGWYCNRDQDHPGPHALKPKLWKKIVFFFRGVKY